MKFLSLFILLSFTLLHATTPQHTLVPVPFEYTPKKGYFTLSNITTVTFTTELAKPALKYLQNHLKKASNYTLTLTQKKHDSLYFTYNGKLKDEAYTLSINPNNITIQAASQAGFFYGTVTLMQLMSPLVWSSTEPSTFKRSWQISACDIYDEPRFKWRGMMLDSARHFFSVNYVKKFIDRMAQHKLNRFHWHLSDDEGWRIEIKKYPLLTKVGATRGPNTKLPYTLFPTLPGPKQKQYSGFYTQEEIKEVVAYAQARSVVILPEIDLPAHAKAAVIAYPILLQNPKDNSHYKSVQGVQNNTLDVGQESTYIFIDNVIKELTTLFPYQYIHMGGDEVPSNAWKDSHSVQKLMQTEKLHNNSEVQAYFFKRVDAILAKHQRKLIAWQEAKRSTSALRNETIFMAWRGQKSTEKLLETSQNVILSPYNYFYFDQQYVKKRGELGHTWAGPTDTKEIYSYQTQQLQKLTSIKADIVGLHSCLWSEHAHSEAIADYLVWPRALAFSELAWSPIRGLSWDDFEKRVDSGALKRLEIQKVLYRQATDYKKF